jgi:hypothetical protein
MTSAIANAGCGRSLPQGFKLVPCKAGSLHYGKYVDESGVFRGWAKRPYSEERELRKALTRAMRSACAAGAVDIMTARRAIDTARTDDFVALVTALRQMTAYFESRHLSQKGLHVCS